MGKKTRHQTLLIEMLTSVYQKVLGNSFATLAPVLQFVHGGVAELKGVGIIDVEYGKTKLIRILNKIANMPPEGKMMDLILEIKRFENKETWKRSFKRKIFSTEQFAKRGLMYERSGFMNLIFSLSVKDGSLYFEQKGTKFAGIPLPKILGVQTTASTIEVDNGWRVCVEVRSPIFGLMLKYSGSIQLEK